MRMWAAFPETLHGTWDEQLFAEGIGSQVIKPHAVL